MREVADVRIHGSTGERPIERFQRSEAAALRSLERHYVATAHDPTRPSRDNLAFT
jgi:hypothetical protein